MVRAVNLPDRYRGSDLVGRSTIGTSLTTAVPQGSERVDLRHIYSIFRRRLRLFGIIVGVFLALAFLFTLTQPKQFQAMADVVILTKQQEALPGGVPGETEGLMRSEEIDTELKIIRSQEMAKQVVRNLRLESDADFLTAVTKGSGLRATLKGLVSSNTSEPNRANASRQLTDAVLAGLKVDRLETAYAMRISYTDQSPARAARIANAFASIYANSAVEAAKDESTKTLALLSSRIDELRAQAQQDFRAVQDFRVRNDLLSAQATQLSEQEAAAYGQQLANARAAAAADRGAANAAGGSAAQATLTSPALQSLRSQRAALSIKVAELSGRYLDGHPALAEARRELGDIDRQIDAETARVVSGTVSGIRATAQASSTQAGAMQTNLGAARARLAQNNRALVGLDDLSRKAQASQALYESYLSRYKEVLARSGSERANARVLSAAKVPGQPISPNMPLNLALGLLLGGLVGTAAALAAESSYSGLTTGEEAETRLGIRYLGGVPLLSSIDLGRLNPFSAPVDAPGSVYAEAIRGVIGSVRQSRNGRNQVVAVTSALPSEGKTSLAAGIARVAAAGGESVIVIDCDLVRSQLTSGFGADTSKPGLREMLSGQVKLGEAMFKDSLSSAMVLPITTVFEDGERLLEKGAFHRLIAMLREHFTMIILDTAPILPIAETRELLALADNVVVTTLWRKTSDTAIRAALKLLPLHAIEDIGLVLNQIDMKKQVKMGLGDSSYYYASYQSYFRQH